MDSIRPIYGCNKKFDPYFIGSCVLIEVEGKKYLITAAHIIDDNDFTTLYSSGNGDKDILVELTSKKAIVTKAEGNNRDNDQLDFAILPLTTEMLKSIGNDVVFLNEKDFNLRKVPVERELHLAMGYPRSKNKKIDKKRKKVTTNPLVYSSSLVIDNEILEFVGGSEKFNLLLDYNNKEYKNEKFEIENSISPVGASGGGLFFIEGMKNLENFKPNVDCNAKLVAILIEVHEEKNIILATKLSVIFDAISTLKYNNT